MHCVTARQAGCTGWLMQAVLLAVHFQPYALVSVTKVFSLPTALSLCLTLPSFLVPGLMGPLPPGIASVTTLISLDVSRDTGLTGTLPTAWSALSSLTYLNVSGDVGINGPLPTAWSTITTLVVLDVSDLAVTGSLPASWGALTNLQSLSVDSEASVKGSIPPDWSLLVQLTYLSVANDQGLSGGLPSGISDFSQIKSLAISG